MMFSVMGFEPGKDELTFEVSINVSVDELAPVMGWTGASDCIGADFRLTAAQIVEIEQLCSVSFPEGMDLYLASSDGSNGS
ncbi:MULTISPECIES: DUF7683 domain-containing protein [Pseudomonas]|uniref:DUF7683 domain-containing protein n=1 Tax=Pseudomonas TaxID=286 RepID=UPI0009B5F872|nr:MULTISPECIES: hypothetical protein [Pseudomonas]POA69330.1 hypothetical protein C1888_17050 [Pseudomonas sp. GW531-T4]PWY40985.1 hypothetical protein DK261_15765 [Pseudomonas sp. RW409]